ncbi:lysylphosphatidylglycerol synthase transmembrane domain-containing protein [Clostridiaceae bacterium 35-E11]
MDFEKLKRGIFISLGIGMVVFVGLSIYSDLGALKKSFVAFDFRFLPMILMLAPLNYLFRYIKWSYYLTLVGVTVDRKDNILIFLSGLSMTITPGKIGEFLKSYLLKERANVPISTTAPLIVGERLTDGMSVLILAGIGVLSYDYGKGILILVLLLMLAFILMVQSPALIHGILKYFHRIPLFQRFRTFILNFYEHAYLILKWKPLLFAVSIGVVSWFFEGVVIYLAVKGLGFQLPLLACVFIVSFSFIVGALSMMPGGLFAVEGSVVGLLLMMHLEKSTAVATTIITRFSTLWLGVALGLMGLMVIYRKKANP